MRGLNHKYLFFLSCAMAVALQFCAPKATKTVTTASYSEDISIYREAEPEPVFDKITKESVKESSIDKTFIEPTNGIETELDSVNKIIMASKADVRYIDGYTIQLYSGNDRDMANQVRFSAIEVMEESKPIIGYEQPNYKVRVGQYYSRLEAYSDFKAFKEAFRRAVLIPYKIPIEEDQ